MARTGLYITDVLKARDRLLAQGKHPSVDAVRVELGNTGSKTTIHKYLRQLEEEDGGGHLKASVSEAIQDLAARLAARLKEEADEQIEGMRKAFGAKELVWAESERVLRSELTSLSGNVADLTNKLTVEAAGRANIRDLLQTESIARHTAEQQVRDLQERLAENDAHRASLEEKHAHARQALEHYRTAAKEQRDQDQRRQEQQVQQLQVEMRQLQHAVVLKQEEVTRLNQDGIRLIADLSNSRRLLNDAQELARRTALKLEKASLVERDFHVVTEKLAERTSETTRLARALEVSGEKIAALSDQVREHELALAAARAAHIGQAGLAEELRRLLDPRAQGVEQAAASDESAAVLTDIPTDDLIAPVTPKY